MTGQVTELEKIDVLGPVVGLSLKGDVFAFVVPGRHGGEAPAGWVCPFFPEVQHHRRPGLLPGKAREGNGAVRGPEVFAVSKAHVVAREGVENPLLALRGANLLKHRVGLDVEQPTVASMLYPGRRRAAEVENRIRPFVQRLQLRPRQPIVGIAEHVPVDPAIGEAKPL